MDKPIINGCYNRSHKAFRKRQICQECIDENIFLTKEVNKAKKELFSFVEDNKEMLNDYNKEMEY